MTKDISTPLQVLQNDTTFHFVITTPSIREVFEEFDRWPEIEVPPKPGLFAAAGKKKNYREMRAKQEGLGILKGMDIEKMSGVDGYAVLLQSKEQMDVFGVNKDSEIYKTVTDCVDFLGRFYGEEDTTKQREISLPSISSSTEDLPIVGTGDAAALPHGNFTDNFIGAKRFNLIASGKSLEDATKEAQVYVENHSKDAIREAKKICDDAASTLQKRKDNRNIFVKMWYFIFHDPINANLKQVQAVATRIGNVKQVTPAELAKALRDINNLPVSVNPPLETTKPEEQRQRGELIVAKEKLEEQFDIMNGEYGALHDQNLKIKQEVVQRNYAKGDKTYDQKEIDVFAMALSDLENLSPDEQEYINKFIQELKATSNKSGRRLLGEGHTVESLMKSKKEEITQQKERIEVLENELDSQKGERDESLVTEKVRLETQLKAGIKCLPLIEQTAVKNDIPFNFEMHGHAYHKRREEEVEGLILDSRTKKKELNQEELRQEKKERELELVKVTGLKNVQSLESKIEGLTRNISSLGDEWKDKFTLNSGVHGEIERTTKLSVTRKEEVPIFAEGKQEEKPIEKRFDICTQKEFKEGYQTVDEITEDVEKLNEDIKNLKERIEAISPQVKRKRQQELMEYYGVGKEEKLTVASSLDDITRKQQELETKRAELQAQQELLEEKIGEFNKRVKDAEVKTRASLLAKDIMKEFEESPELRRHGEMTQKEKEKLAENVRFAELAKEDHEAATREEKKRRELERQKQEQQEKIEVAISKDAEVYGAEKVKGLSGSEDEKKSVKNAAIESFKALAKDHPKEAEQELRKVRDENMRAQQYAEAKIKNFKGSTEAKQQVKNNLFSSFKDLAQKNPEQAKLEFDKVVQPTKHATTTTSWFGMHNPFSTKHVEAKQQQSTGSEEKKSPTTKQTKTSTPTPTDDDGGSPPIISH